jgi:hypothetical protein
MASVSGAGVPLAEVRVRTQPLVAGMPVTRGLVTRVPATRTRLGCRVG